MATDNSYSTPGTLLQEILGLLGQYALPDLMRQIQYLKVENEILRSKAPKCQRLCKNTPLWRLKNTPFGLMLKHVFNQIRFSKSF